jgi:hypothetical protein
VGILLWRKKKMKEIYNTTISIEKINKEKYDMLMDFLQDNDIEYEETDFEEYTIDNRSEQQKYDDWLWEQADIKNDDKNVGII